MYLLPMCGMSPTRVSWESYNRDSGATRAGSAPSIMASTEPITPTRKLCSATDSGALLPVNHQPVLRVRVRTGEVHPRRSGCCTDAERWMRPEH